MKSDPFDALLPPERIREARKLLGWTQIVLAKAAKVSEDTVRGCERGGDLLPEFKLRLAVRKALERAGIGFVGGTVSYKGGPPALDLTMPQSFAERLKALCRNRGISGPQLAKAVGLHPATIRRYEQGGHEPPRDLLPRFAQALSCTVQDFQLRPLPHHARAAGPESRVKELRRARGWSQGELARHAGVSQGAISNIETQKRIPEREMVLKLAVALECRFEDLMGG